MIQLPETELLIEKTKQGEKEEENKAGWKAVRVEVAVI